MRLRESDQCEHILEKYEALQEQEMTLLSYRSNVAPGPCPPRQEQEVQSQGRGGAAPGQSTRLSGLGTTDSPVPFYSLTCSQDAEPCAPVGGLSLDTTPSPGEEEAVSKMPRPHTATVKHHWTVGAVGYHLGTAQRQHGEVERV